MAFSSGYCLLIVNNLLLANTIVVIVIFVAVITSNFLYFLISVNSQSPVNYTIATPEKYTSLHDYLQEQVEQVKPDCKGNFTNDSISSSLATLN